MKPADDALSPQAAVDRIMAARQDYRRKLAKLSFQDKFRMVAEMRGMTDGALRPKQVAGHSDAGSRVAAETNGTTAALQPNDRLIQRLRANREIVDRTDKRVRLCPGESRYEHYITFKGPTGMTLGWIAVGTLRARPNAVDLLWIEARTGGQRGCGDDLIKELCRYADEEGVVVTLRAAPWEEQDLNRLMDWYERHGFVLDSPPRTCRLGQSMTRQPRRGP